MEQAHVQEVEEVIYGIRLPKDFKHYKPEVGFTCKTKDVALDSYVECLEKDSHECPFSMSYADSHYCTSPARVYVTKILEN